MLLRELASEIEMDQALLSKIERSERVATELQVRRISKFFELNDDQLIVSWLCEKIKEDLDGYEKVAEEVLNKLKSDF